MKPGLTLLKHLILADKCLILMILQEADFLPEALKMPVMQITKL
jgi:hypothetical protein